MMCWEIFPIRLLFLEYWALCLMNSVCMVWILFKKFHFERNISHATLVSCSWILFSVWRTVSLWISFPCNYCFLNIGCSCDPVQQPSYRKRIILSSPGDNIHYTSIVNIFVNILKMYKYAACSFCYISFWEGNNKLKSILEVKGQN